MQSKTIIGPTVNPVLAYVIASSTLLLISFFIVLPYISEGLYLLII